MATESRGSEPGRDLAGIILAVIFILVAVAALWDTTNMADSDSYVFPRAVAIAMIVFSMALIVWNLLRPVPGTRASAAASTPRRIGLVAAMLVSAAAMPYLGFLISGLGAFVSIMLVSMYEAWSGYRKLVYPLVAVAVVLAFYTIFAKVLLVPLPVGQLFE